MPHICAVFRKQATVILYQWGRICVRVDLNTHMPLSRTTTLLREVAVFGPTPKSQQHCTTNLSRQKL